MPRFPVISEEEASGEAAHLFADFRQKMGFPAAPNFIRTQGGTSIDVARGTWGLVENVLVKGVLPRSLKEMMFVAISRDRMCGYCEAAHVACCKMLGTDEATIAAVVENVDELNPARIRDSVKFSVKCARDPKSLEDADFEILRDHGLGDAEIMEIIAMSGLAVFANIMADATKLDNDEMFCNYDS